MRLVHYKGVKYESGSFEVGATYDDNWEKIAELSDWNIAEMVMELSNVTSSKASLVAPGTRKAAYVSMSDEVVKNPYFERQISDEIVL